MISPSTPESARRTLNHKLGATFGSKLGLVVVAGLAFGACTTGADSDSAEDGAPVIGSAPVDESNAESIDVIGSEAAVDSSTIDDAEPDDLAMVEDREISEAPASEPEVEDNPEIDEDGDIDVPQAELGPGESVLCASVQIGLDALRDGAEDLAGQQRDRLVEGRGSIADRQLADLIEALEDGANEALFSTALDRCEGLGYER
jgi:hypothetical protein